MFVWVQCPLLRFQRTRLQLLPERSLGQQLLGGDSAFWQIRDFRNQIASAQNNCYATMASSGPFILNLILVSHFRQCIATLSSDSAFLILNCTHTASNPTTACFKKDLGVPAVARWNGRHFWSLEHRFDPCPDTVG